MENFHMADHSEDDISVDGKDSDVLKEVTPDKEQGMCGTDLDARYSPRIESEKKFFNEDIPANAMDKGSLIEDENSVLQCQSPPEVVPSLLLSDSPNPVESIIERDVTKIENDFSSIPADAMDRGSLTEDERGVQQCQSPPEVAPSLPLSDSPSPVESIAESDVKKFEKDFNSIPTNPVDRESWSEDEGGVLQCQSPPEVVPSLLLSDPPSPVVSILERDIRKIENDLSSIPANIGSLAEDERSVLQCQSPPEVVPSVLSDPLCPVESILERDVRKIENDLSSIPANVGSLAEDERSVLQCQSPPEVVPSLVLSDPPSPVDSIPERDVKKIENDFSSSRKKFSLPYFQLPKPDLDEFLIETDKNLQIYENKIGRAKEYGFPLPSESKLRKDIMVSMKPNMCSQDNLFNENQGSITFSLDISSDCSKDGPLRKVLPVPKSNIHHKTSMESDFNNEYRTMRQIGESESDNRHTAIGFKRFALRELLMKKMEDKKYEIFSKSRASYLENEEFQELQVESSDEECESSDEECEETTVLDSLKKNEDCSESLSEDDNQPEELCESSDEEIGVWKRKKFHVLEEDSDNSNVSSDFSSLKKNEIGEVNSEYDTATEKHKISLDAILPMDDVSSETFDKDMELSENCACGEGYFQTSHCKLSQISASIPSYQPAGGFLNEDMQHENSNISSTSENSSAPTEYKILNEESGELEAKLTDDLLRPSNLLDTSTIDEMSLNTSLIDVSVPSFGLKLDDLPVSLSENESDIFSTGEVNDVCSGAFKSTISQMHLEYTPKERESYIPEERICEFIDDEAELSGEDDGLDDISQDGSEDEALNISDEVIPDDVLREEIAGLHMKYILDEDAEIVKHIQEKFLDDGELNTGQNRSRRFAWKNNDNYVEACTADKDSNSGSDTEGPAVDDTFSSVNQDKAKWREENKVEVEDLTEELNSSGYKKRSSMKVNIIGKPRFSRDKDSSEGFSSKRPRGSLFNLDDSSASQVLKKLKASEENYDGSRTTKHFVFRNGVFEDLEVTKEVPMNFVCKNPDVNDTSDVRSIFNKI